MIFTARQNDALTELINIAFARTGAALSELTGHRVVLNPPEVAVYRVPLNLALQRVRTRLGIAVDQREPVE